MFNIEEELKKLPSKPGVYIMKDKQDNIIYVGKAVVLKNRVRSYFRKNNKTPRINKMVSLIDHFEYIVVDNEAEALILECNLIKENRPKFNVLLKDDKTYPYIKLDLNFDYPKLYLTRKIVNDGSKYFGPYANLSAAKAMIEFIDKKYKMIEYRIFNLTKKMSKDEYKKVVEEITNLLEGKTEKVIKEIDLQIKELSKKLKFEEAAFLRDKKIAIERFSEKQKVSNISENNIDVIGLSKSEIQVCIEIFFVRGSKMIGRKHYFFKELKDMEDKEILSGFIKQFYLNNLNIPNKIMIREVLDDKEAIEEWLSLEAKRKVEIKSPKKGEKLRFVEMAEMNSRVALKNKENNKSDLLLELKEVLNLDKLPKKIEIYDISNISGDYMVAAMCVMEDAVIKKNLSKRFKIKGVFTQNDVKCMEEVVTRRLKHSIENIKGNFGDFPDVIFVDGGITQIKAVKKVVQKYNLYTPIFGLVKNNKHQTRAIMNDKREELKISDDLMNLVTKFQDTVHETAIDYHRKLRDKEIKKSELDYVPGIGESKKKALLKEFGSVKKIKKASIEDLVKVKGISKSLAEIILDKLK